MMIVLRPDVIPTYYSYWFRGHHHTYCTTPQTDFESQSIHWDRQLLTIVLILRSHYSIWSMRDAIPSSRHHQTAICEYVLHRAGKVSIGRALRKCSGGNVVADICGRLVQINLSIVYSINCVWPHHILCEEYYGKKWMRPIIDIVDSMQCKRTASSSSRPSIGQTDGFMSRMSGFVVICGQILVLNIAICNR